VIGGPGAGGRVPGGLSAALEAADASALALSEAVVHEAHVGADPTAPVVLDIPGLGGEVLFEKILEPPLADEADAGAVLLGMGGEALGRGDPPHLGLLQLAHGEQGAGEGALLHGVEKIALVLV